MIIYGYVLTAKLAIMTNGSGKSLAKIYGNVDALGVMGHASSYRSYTGIVQYPHHKTWLKCNTAWASTHLTLDASNFVYI